MMLPEGKLDFRRRSFDQFCTCSEYLLSIDGEMPHITTQGNLANYFNL